MAAKARRGSRLSPLRLVLATGAAALALAVGGAGAWWLGGGDAEFPIALSSAEPTPSASAYRASPDPTQAGDPTRGSRSTERRALGAARNRGVPLRLRVPTLGIDARVVAIDVEGGVLEPPGDPSLVGWWGAGARPGAARGSALLTAHTVHSGGGAFDDLERVRRGAVLRVDTPKGGLRYRVDSVRVLRKQRIADEAKSLFDQTVPGRLVLVTCEDYNGYVYLSNVVVVARRVP